MVNAGLTCLLLFCLCLEVNFAMPSYEEDRIGQDKEQYIRQLAAWLANQSETSLNDIMSMPPCRPCFYPNHPMESLSIAHNPYVKRNSELINSLLSLPRAMNEVGK
ncbi:pigment-dispersing hormone peptides [Wyeomyia smithii]|uniref:pigment-dispersing hormone peptides n=1 Tax=Wyeomyia smithii TaxID=174621 RepID=UPI002467E50A|nr:pigment-dispersing hormone peptides [Wyeomyia smithii]